MGLAPTPAVVEMFALVFAREVSYCDGPWVLLCFSVD